MKVLYIGGTGEISYSCVRESVRLGHDVTVFNRGRGDEPLPPGVRQVIGDLADAAAYARLADGRFDAVCQFLAFEPAQIERDVETFAGRIGQYVFISSASAYQKPPRTWRLTEDVPLANPYWPYSAAKAVMEQRLMDLHRAGRLNVTIVRPSHTYRRRIPGTFIKGNDVAWRMLHGRATLSFGDGTSLWTLTHSDDFAVPFARLLGNARALGEAFHVTSDDARLWDDILHTLGRALGVSPRIVHVPSETLVRCKPDWTGPLLGDKAAPAVFDNRKVKSVAGDFTCKVSLDAGLRVAADLFLQRDFRGDPTLHDLLDRIADQQGRISP